MAQHIPQQITGKSLDCFETIDTASTVDAQQLFDKIKTKILQVNNWHQITGKASAEFAVMDEHGLDLKRSVQKGDYIRIDIPGPGLPSANGYDWVQVEAIREEFKEGTRRFSLTLRPSPDPSGDNTDTAHFFKQISSSSILLEQKENHLALHYAGRNEVVNTSNSAILDNLRNFMVGLGAKMGASFPQWRALIEGLANLYPQKTIK
ncbi:hypothetical protein [Sphingobacterium yanglingense]|uniref:Uncharacterized protein n=1 Tax=Sphingobacterium yanglingense TaxID=1437280 RepID=A0A4R6WIM3_9SPHI|nr:hypothetical protein [Sphingobacterium yanglingense]TDQ80014.1 hypothetical protein CLV99_1468 [Sphingobacterium yanglingense]